MKECLTFLDYDKISDNLMFLGRNVSLNFNVSLAYKTPEGSRRHFHSEYRYKSKYNDVSNVCSVKRTFDYYLTIDVKGDMDNSIMIRTSNMIMLKLKLAKVAEWFTTLFKVKNDRLCIIGDYENISMLLPANKAIVFEPVIINYEDETCKEGVRLFINNNEIYTDLTIDRFMELWYLIDNLNMYQSAIVLLNYMHSDLVGINLYDMTSRNNNTNDDIEDMSIPIIERPNKSTRVRKEYKGSMENSFFNKM